MLYPHEFVTDGHYYKVKGFLEFCYATTDIIEMNGMSDFLGVPPSALRHASERGTLVHKLVEGDRKSLKSYGPEIVKEAHERMEAYERFRKCHTLEILQAEKTMVYRHLGTEAFIGVTPDMYARISCTCEAIHCPLRGLKDALCAVEIKTLHRQYGEKLKQLRLKWWMQLESQVEALEADDAFWKKFARPDVIEKVVIHLHPDCGKIRGASPSGFEVHRFPADGQYLWDSMVRIAKEKLANGYKLNRFYPATQEVPLAIF